MNPEMPVSANTATLPPLLTLRGSAADRGHAYGEQARQRIGNSVRTYQQMFAAIEMPWSDVCQRAEPFEEAIGSVFPTILAELRGVAAGSGIDFRDLLALNCRTELLPANYLALASQQAPNTLPDGGQINECTSFAVSDANMSVLLAQNWDWLGAQREALVVLDQRPAEGCAHVTVAEAGMMAKIGLNEHGLGVTLNILRSHEDGRQVGMPVHALLRGLLECESVEQACELALSLTYCSSSNVLIADAQGQMASLECSPRGAIALAPQRHGARASLCHTNHFCDPSLAKIDASVAGNLSTTERLDRAHALIDSVDSFEVAGQLLSDTTDGLTSICRFPDPDMAPEARIETVVSTIMDLSKRRLYVSAAQPSATPYELIELPELVDGYA